MTDIAQKKDQIKKNIRSLLLSSPAALTLNELKRDYHSFMGEPIEFSACGYVSIEGFLRDIGDAVSISYRNGMMTLKAKADESTAHIQRLVSKQKVPNKKKYAVYRQRGGSSGPPRRYQTPETSRFPPRRYNQPQMAPPPPMVPAFVRQQMKELFSAFPDGVSVMQLDKAFLRHYGTGINYRHYGFLNQYEFLQSLSDILTVEELGRGEWYVLPVGYRRRRPEPVPVVTPTPEPAVQPVVQPTIEQPTSDVNRPRPSKGRGRGRRPSDNSDSTPVGNTQLSPESSPPTPRKQEENLLENNIQMVLEKYPKGLWASRFTQEYLSMHGKPIPYRKLGHLSVVELVASMPHIVSINRPHPQGDWMFYDARHPPETASNNARSRHSSGKPVEVETKEAIQYVLKCHPTGINVKDFPKLFKDYTGKDLPYEELGFNVPEDLFVSLADSDLQISYTGSGMAMYPKDVELPDITEILNERLSNTETATTDNPPTSECPQDVVGPGCHYLPVKLPDEKTYIELYVTNIISPGLFWVMLRHRTKSLALEELMDRLAEEYTYNNDKYKMPESLMVPGQVCAALFPEDNNWHRTVITGSNEEGFIQCYYVDYGNTNYITKDSIRFLKTEFLAFPAQAVQSRLANTQPVGGGKWKNKSRNILLELTSHRPLVAYVYEVKCQKMSICLIDTGDPVIDVHINDLMVNEGLAQLVPDTEGCTNDTHALEPDYDHVFGWNVVEVPRLPKVVQGQFEDNNNQKPESDETEYKNARYYVKWIQLTDDYVIHLISLNGVGYLLSAEISVLFWEEDILTSMLKQRRVDIPKLTLSKDENPELFADLNKYNVPSIRSTGGVEKKFVTVYKLESVPQILYIFEHEDENLLKAVNELVTKFDPNSPYWKSGGNHGNSTPATETGEEKMEPVEPDHEDLEEDLSLEEKQTALQTLQFKRKRILQTMISNSDILTDDMVNELNNIEIEIVVIKQQIADHQNTGKTDAPTNEVKNQPQEQHSQLSESQRVIQNIMDSTTKPIATANIMTQPAASVSSMNQQTQSHDAMTNSSWMTQGLMSQSMTSFSDMMLQSAAMLNQSAGGFPGMMNQSAQSAGGFPGMMNQSTGGFPMTSQSTGGFPMPSQSTGGFPMPSQSTGGFPMTSQSTGGFPMTSQSTGMFPGMGSQATAGFPGMMGVQNPRLMNPSQMNAGQMNTALMTGMGDLTNSMFPRMMGFGGNMNQGLQTGLLPQFNPMMMPCQNVDTSLLTGMTTTPLMPNIGRGQSTLAPGILPGLLPLVQNLNLGRGSNS